MKAVPFFDHTITKHRKVDFTHCLLHICRRTGYLLFGQGTEEYIKSNMETLKSNGIPHEIFNGLEANQRFPRQLKLSPSHKCVYEEVGGGVLYAQRALMAFQV